MAYVMAKAGNDGNDGGAVRLPGSLQVNRRLDRWLRVAEDGCVEIFSGKVELGQGILTALAQIAAEELDLRLDQVRMVAATTACSPNEAVTSGSLSIQESGAALRQACAEARRIWRDAAAAALGVEAGSLHAVEGRFIAADGRSVTYRQIAAPEMLAREASGDACAKDASQYRAVGAALPRIDLPDKVFGRPRFIHDLEFPGMLHGAVLRPPTLSSTLLSLPDVPMPMDGAQAVRDGSLVGVLAASRRDAMRALGTLAAQAQWSAPAAPLPDERALGAWLRSQPADSHVVSEKAAPQAAPAVGMRTFRAAYAKPFTAHASIAPSCALAHFDGTRLHVWTHSQGIYNLRKDLALCFGMAEDEIVVQHVEGAGCYGHNGADDAAFDAAWLARATPGRAVRVLWSRADELGVSPFGPAMAIELEAGVDASGAVAGWRHAVWSNGHSTRPGRAPTPALRDSWHLAQPFPVLTAVNAPLAAGGGAERNAVPSYDFPAWHVVSHRVTAMPLRTSALRALGAFGNVFAVESFLDEIAAELDCDPIEFRLRHTVDPRAAAVIRSVVERSGWHGMERREGCGRGIGFARYKNTSAYCAVVAEIRAEAEIRVAKLTIAVDVGMAINPDGVVNQIEGGAIQAVSWALKEAVRFDRDRVTSDSWETYPILRFSEVPDVDTLVLPSAAPPVGAGEASLGPTAAAIGNAVFDALGVRVRELPITAERILAACE